MYLETNTMLKACRVEPLILICSQMGRVVIVKRSIRIEKDNGE